MKEKEFLNELKRLNMETLEIKPYYSLDESGNIWLDEEGIKEELNDKIDELKELEGVGVYEDFKEIRSKGGVEIEK